MENGWDGGGEELNKGLFILFVKSFEQYFYWIFFGFIFKFFKIYIVFFFVEIETIILRIHVFC